MVSVSMNLSDLRQVNDNIYKNANNSINGKSYMILKETVPKK